MGLDLIEPSRIATTDALPNECYIAQAYYLGYGRNAWRSTWSNIYMSGSVSFDLRDLKRSAEKQRTQGSVFWIESIPVLVLQYPKGGFGIVPINDRSKYEYDLRLVAMAGLRPWEFWTALPTRSANWLLVFNLPTARPKAESYTSLIFKAKSGGTKHSLCWHQLNGRGYTQFLHFADAITSLLAPSPPVNSNTG